ncbi:hypothetical protein HEAR0283 [Herminiimonas arsenicoxydans]|uniref:Uncharacterized protein n=1 Tax=Herminiimonas arsenicoxydans TaxID=204773 RepID=A4G1X3_HERAR|nr:hypothetical protein HEAR0283 [Herminiimonas arsenicoxydans]
MLPKSYSLSILRPLHYRITLISFKHSVANTGATKTESFPLDRENYSTDMQKAYNYRQSNDIYTLFKKVCLGSVHACRAVHIAHLQTLA